MWPDTPSLYSIDYGYAEAFQQFGRDPREYLIAIKRFTTSESGQVTGVWTIQTTKTKNESGAVIFEEIEGSDRYFPVDQVWIRHWIQWCRRECTRTFSGRLGNEGKSRRRVTRRTDQAYLPQVTQDVVNH